MPRLKSRGPLARLEMRQRPLGVGLLIAAVEWPSFSLYELEPSGMFLRWSARAMGQGMEQAEALLEKDYQGEGSTLQDCLKVALHIMDTVHTDTNTSTNTNGSRPLEVAKLVVGEDGKPRLENISEQEISRARRELVTMGGVYPK